MSATKAELLELAERVEALTGPCRETFLEVFAVCHPEPAPGCEPVWREENPKQPIYHAWKTRQVAFLKFVNAEAWLDAAMTLVPEGWMMVGLSERNCRQPQWRWKAELWHPEADANVRGIARKFDHPALALTAAALRARSHGEPA
jgi:hypothetical protein